MANAELLGFFAKKRADATDNALKYYDVVLEMLRSGDYIYAEDFLASVITQIQEKEFISANQIESVEKIKSKRGKPKRYRR